ncbi:MAG: pyridoxamine 5'-phosphate oxidase family protein [Phycisphaerae bacterium]
MPLPPISGLRSPIATVPAVYALLQRRIPSRGPNDYGVLATTDASGHARARYVVLRGFESASHRLWINTNRTSAKVADLRRRHGKTGETGGTAEVCLWLARSMIQLRLLAHWQILDVQAAAASPESLKFYKTAWKQQPLYAKTLYPGPKHEGIPSDFCVLVGTLIRIDALRLTIPRHEQYVHELVNGQWQSEVAH